MAVQRLSGAWVLHVLSDWPDGIQRRNLLDLFAAELVTARSRRGAKGRVAVKLYRILERLQWKNLASTEDGLVRFVVQGASGTPKTAEEHRLLTAPLRRALFQALMAEDRANGLGERVVHARTLFILLALEEGWSEQEIGRALGARTDWVASVIAGLRGRA